MSRTFNSLKIMSEEKIAWIVDSIALRYKMQPLHVIAEMLRGRQVIVLDYPLESMPRYGFGKPSHPIINEIIEKEKNLYVNTLKSFLIFKKNFLSIPKWNKTDSTMPCWINEFIPGLDAVALYSFLALNKPQRYFEIGSGNSTKFARKAITDHNLPTRITAIDPKPRVDIIKICDNMIRKPVEEVDLTIFDELEANDILFIDNSHRCFMNSDVTVVFLDIMPRLKSGVFIEIHDITLPWDYPHAYIERYYSEQYLLAMLLLMNNKKYKVILPNWFISRVSEFNHLLDSIWTDPAMENVERHGCSFWLKKM